MGSEAALGTSCAQMISVVMSTCFFFFKKGKAILLGEIISSCGYILKSQSGDVAITAYGIVSKIHGFFIMPCSGIVQGMQPIVGYNFGRGDFKRVRSQYRKGAD